MKEILEFYANKLSASSLSLKKKSLLVDKPWAFITGIGVLMKLIFRSNGKVIISQDGIVSEGEWEYITKTKNLLFGDNQKKYLLKEVFLDSNVLVMRTESTEKDFVAMVNEDEIINHDAVAYLKELYFKKNQIRSFYTNNGFILDVHKSEKVNSLTQLQGHVVDIKDIKVDLHMPSKISSGHFQLEEENVCFYVTENKISSIFHVLKKEDEEGKLFSIEVNFKYPHPNRGCLVRDANNNIVSQNEILTVGGELYKISEGRILDIGMVDTYYLEEGLTLHVENFSQDEGEPGFLIRHVEPETTMTDGKYKDRDFRKSYYIVNNRIVSKRRYNDRTCTKGIKPQSYNLADGFTSLISIIIGVVAIVFYVGVIPIDFSGDIPFALGVLFVPVAMVLLLPFLVAFLGLGLARLFKRKGFRLFKILLISIQVIGLIFLTLSAIGNYKINKHLKESERRENTESFFEDFPNSKINRPSTSIFENEYIKIPIPLGYTQSPLGCIEGQFYNFMIYSDAAVIRFSASHRPIQTIEEYYKDYKQILFKDIKDGFTYLKIEGEYPGTFRDKGAFYISYKGLLEKQKVFGYTIFYIEENQFMCISSIAAKKEVCIKNLEYLNANIFVKPVT